MLLLYESGFPREKSRLRGARHPALLAIAAGTLKGAQIAIMHSGAPAAECVNTAEAVAGGESFVRYAQGLSEKFHEATAEAAALYGQLGALRYAHERGAVWDHATLLAAVEGDSLECLRYANEGGCPHHFLGDRSLVATWWENCVHPYSKGYTNIRCPPRYQVSLTLASKLLLKEPIFPAAWSLPVLRYACEHMGPTWREGVLRATAAELAKRIHWATGIKFHVGDVPMDWQMALYTVQNLRKVLGSMGMAREPIVHVPGKTLSQVIYEMCLPLWRVLCTRGMRGSRRLQEPSSRLAA